MKARKIIIHFFYAPRLKIGGILFLSCVSFSNSVKFANNLWTLSARALIFNMSIPCDKTFPCEPYFFYPVSLTLEFYLLFENLNLANNFWTMRARALIFYITILCDKTFLWVPTFFTLWPWSRNLTFFLNHYLFKIFSYFTWILLLMRSFSWN